MADFDDQDQDTEQDSDQDPSSSGAPIAGDDDSAGGAVRADDVQILITKEGLRKLKEEYELLRTVRRKEIAERLKEAISYGDLSENAEYEEAKNEQAFVEGRILELEQQIKNAKIISEKHAKKSRMVDIGSQVTVREKGGKHDSETYTIVGSTEADPIGHKISNESPIGKALLGCHEGEVVDVSAPGGKFKYEILKVS